MSPRARGLALAALLLVGGGCASKAHEPDPAVGAASPTTEATPVTPPGPQDEAETAKIARVLTLAAGLRELPEKKAVPGRVLERDELLTVLKAHVKRELPPDVLDREGKALKLMGLAPVTLDYEKVMFGLLEAELAGFYLPEDGTMYIAKDLDEETGRATLVHELIHALQDQNFDLKAQSKYKPGQGDQTFARSVLAEGDATSPMLDFALQSAGVRAIDLPDAQAEALMLAATAQAASPDTPRILQRSLIAPYVVGLQLVNRLRREGGWAAVDAVWKNMPTTSEQVLHADKLASREPALTVAAPLAANVGPGFVVKDEDTGGEQGFVLIFDELTKPSQGKVLARGWGGDRSSFFEHPDGRIAAVDHLRYDADAKLMATTVVGALASAAGIRVVKDKKGVHSACIERDQQGPFAFAAKGADVVLVMGPTNANTWTSTSTCKAALTTALAELDR